MSHTLQLSLSSIAFNSSLKVKKLKKVKLCCFQNSKDDNDDDADDNGGSVTNLNSCFVS
jgi:hypothetical protein